MSDLLQAALRLAGEGVPVFPCNPDKSPRVAMGFHVATTDEDKIRSWDWNGGGLIGMPIQPGTIVVDIDPRNGGESTIEMLRKGGGVFPETREVRTRSGGTHLYYEVPEGIELRGKLGPGVDIKKPGKGYVIVPPSPGYEPMTPLKHAWPAPQWLLDELVVQPREHSGQESEPKYFRFQHGTAYGLGAMKAELATLGETGEGGRNDALNKAAFSLAQLAAGGELDAEHAKQELARVALDIGLEEDEAAATILSGWAAGEQDPRQAPVVSSEAQFPVTGNKALPETAEAEGRFWNDWEVDEGPLPFYCEPLIPKNAYILVYGATEASKSMAMVGLLAEGSLHGVKSTVYSLENPPSMDRSRLRRWAPDKRHFRLTNEMLDMNDPLQVNALIEREKAWGTDIILIDTYSHAFNSRSEDGNAKAIEFARRIRFVMQQVGCSVIIVDHTGYAHDDEPRDASAKRQQVDVAVLMSKAGQWQPGKPARFTAKNTKSGRFGNPFFLNGEIHDVERDGEKGLELRWAGGEVRWAA